ncbi:MAG: hypothetical protein QM536_07335 [Chitinophagaceae bacterium]|nr:hypothetical protein [Chitinophagaceae bacterium]
MRKTGFKPYAQTLQVLKNRKNGRSLEIVKQTERQQRSQARFAQSLLGSS